MKMNILKKTVAACSVAAFMAVGCVSVAQAGADHRYVRDSGRGVYSGVGLGHTAAAGTWPNYLIGTKLLSVSCVPIMNPPLVKDMTHKVVHLGYCGTSNCSTEAPTLDINYPYVTCFDGATRSTTAKDSIGGLVIPTSASSDLFPQLADGGGVDALNGNYVGCANPKNTLTLVATAATETAPATGTVTCSVTPVSL